MKKKRILIISFNHLPTSFWKEHLDLSEAEVWHFHSTEMAINNLTTIWPDAIIVDGYFAKEPYEFCLKSILKKNIPTRIYRITPKEQLQRKYLSINKRLVYSKLSSNILEELNSFINSIDKSYERVQLA